MNITASAPGKLVLLGEYAVLEGAPAISMAVNRRAIAHLKPRAGNGCQACAPTFSRPACHSRLAPMVVRTGRPRPMTPPSCRWVDQVLRGLAAGHLGPAPASGFELALDTQDFFDSLGRADDAQKLKLGLGSSAALTVALATALVAHAGHEAAAADPRLWLQDLLALHRQFQGGQGSGVDVATSLMGGVISYRLAADAAGDCQLPVAQEVRWPETVQRLYVWSGRSASTPKLLGILKHWRISHEAEYRARMSALTAIAEAAVSTLAQGDGRSLIEAAAAYADGLRALGTASGVTIYSEEHTRIGAIAAETGVIYKPCGAGGGDVGVVLALNDAERLEACRLRLREAGFESVPLAVDDTGLKLEFTEIDEA